MSRDTLDAAVPSAVAASARPPSVLASVAIMLGGASSNQVGAALGAHAFPLIGPAGVVAVRQFVAAAVLLPVARPPFRRMTRAQWWPTVLLGAVYGAMNLALYSAIERIGLGLAVTLEFLGPLAVALVASRTARDVLVALAAGTGVYVLVLPGPASDWLGIGLGLVAAGCWAAYIVLNRTVGQRLPGLQAPAAATTVASLLYLPVLLGLVWSGRLTLPALAYAALAGVLASAVPYAADLVCLRRVSRRFFSVFMSVHPVLAAVSGAVLLGEVLALHEWLGIVVVVAANAVTVLAAAGPPGGATPQGAG